MDKLTIAMIGAGMFTAITAVPVMADSMFELEHARANARAGGPVSEDDAEWLARWGALSGTPGWRDSFRGAVVGDDEANRRRRRDGHLRPNRD